MSLSSVELLRVADELSLLAGARVQKVSVPAPSTVVVDLRQPGRTYRLLLEAAERVARAAIVEGKPPSPEKPFAFQGLLRAHVAGARIDRVQGDPQARTLTLGLSTDRGPRSLVLEVSQRGGLLALLDEADLVMGATPPDASRERGLVRGERYRPPSPPAETSSRDRFPAGGELAVSRAIEAHYGAVTGDRDLARARAEVLPALRAARRKAARTLEKVRADRARIAEAAEYQRLGDLLKPVLHALQRGATEAVATEYGEEGAREVRVPLLPNLSPRENMDRYYHLHRRLTRSAGRVDERLADVAAGEERLAALVREAEAAQTVEALEAIADRARTEGLFRPAPAAAGRARGAAPRLPFREYASASGRRIWVGRSARDNDALTFRHARGNDTWLHARGLPGSHVVVPGTGPDGPDGETLLDAATLAAHYSGARSELVVDVAVTRRKYVHKPKGAPPGAVHYTQDRNVQLRHDAARLARLLAQQDDAPRA